MKGYTDLPQSKKLAEILPIESADMAYCPSAEDDEGNTLYTADFKTEFIHNGEGLIPCWSLAALLDVLPFSQLSKDKLGSGKVGWMVSVYPDSSNPASCWHDNPIDACYEMIVKLHERKVL